ncbi:hypothetical protein [Desulfitobacterium sp.]|uniref:hypothetical protein n=1 Tax=Desulfitobacterium sp. TaxID=49981 RepID=UPI002C8BA09E|nr:hypothetical protein [Desulfitobacterium sp.]HVJ48889.1 hypothetical protein [Desulfitobacterium sp.]
MATATVQVKAYVGTKELKIAIEKYAEALEKPVWEVIAETWTKMLASGNFNISVNTLYEESSETGIARRKNQAHRCFSLTMPPDLISSVDDILLNLKKKSNKRGINRSSWTQEAIRRYLEPELIVQGYLDISQFKDKRQAAINLVTFRESLKLSRSEFLDKYLTVNGQLLLSYPQYSVIERIGKGNIDRILDRISVVTENNINKDAFYQAPPDFNKYLNKL